MQRCDTEHKQDKHRSSNDEQEYFQKAEGERPRFLCSAS